MRKVEVLPTRDCEAGYDHDGKKKWRYYNDKNELPVGP